MMNRKSGSIMRLDHGLMALLGLILSAPGCDRRSDEPGKATSPSAEVEVGPHGGIVAEVGPRAHAEILCDDGGNLEVYFLDEEITSPVKVDDATIAGFGVVADQGPIPTRLSLTRKMGEGNHFHVATPAEWQGKRAAVVVPKILIAGQRWHFDFEIDIPLASSQSESPSPPTNDDGPPAERNQVGSE